MSTDTKEAHAAAFVENIAKMLRLALREGGVDAKLHVGDLLHIIDVFQSGAMPDNAPITGPFYPRDHQ